MRAAVAYEVGAPLEVVEITPSKLGPTDVLVRVGAAGLCHSDVSVQDGALPWPLPMVLGHEGAGTIEQVGSAVTRVRAGDRIAMAAILHCGECRYCAAGTPTLCAWGLPYMFESMAPGGPARATDGAGRDLHQMACLGMIAEQVVIPERAAIVIGDDVPFDVAAILGCAVTTGVGAVFNRARVTPGETAAIVGCGGVGLNSVQAARISGARMIIGVDPVARKRELALEFGATHVVDPADGDPVAQVKELTGGWGADAVVETVGAASAVQQAWDMAGMDGRVVVVGVPEPSVAATFNVQAMSLSHKTLTGCFYGGGRPHQDTPVYLDMYRRGELKIDELITRRYAIDEVNDAVADLNAGKNARGVFMLGD